jgi:uncharacterized membrane protein
MSMGEAAKQPTEAKVELRTITVEKTITEADRKFILAATIVIAYVIMLLIPIVTNNTELFKTIAATMTGVVGTIIGYYFGSKKE